MVDVPAGGPDDLPLLMGEGDWDLGDGRLALYLSRTPDPETPRIGGQELFVGRNGDRPELVVYIGEPDSMNTCRFTRL